MFWIGAYAMATGGFLLSFAVVGNLTMDRVLTDLERVIALGTAAIGGAIWVGFLWRHLHRAVNNSEQWGNGGTYQCTQPDDGKQSATSQAHWRRGSEMVMADNHASHLGKLVGNLQSLEALLRVYLLNIAHKQTPPMSVGPSYWSLSVGDVVAEDAFTNFDSLGALIGKFNSDVQSRDVTLRVDPAVIPLRDLLAHGRLAADSPDPSRLKIVKFDKPDGGNVKVVASALMDEAWFKAKNDLVIRQLQNVHKAYERFAF